jgi:hypothetical protein
MIISVWSLFTVNNAEVRHRFCNIEAGVHDATGVWEVGDRVEVIFGNNAFGKYFPGVVHKVHEELPLANNRHWFADKAVALYYLCCCHVSKQRATR